MCIRDISMWSSWIYYELLLRSPYFAVYNNNIWIHFRLGCFGTADWAFETAKPFFADLRNAYLILAPMAVPLPVPLSLVLPAFNEDEFSPWELIQI